MTLMLSLKSTVSCTGTCVSISRIRRNVKLEHLSVFDENKSRSPLHLLTSFT